MLRICTQPSAVEINAGRLMSDNADDGLLITRLPAVLRFHGIHSNEKAAGNNGQQWQTCLSKLNRQIYTS
jgi:hypothetical protein